MTVRNHLKVQCSVSCAFTAQTSQSSSSCTWIHSVSLWLWGSRSGECPTAICKWVSSQSSFSVSAMALTPVSQDKLHRSELCLDKLLHFTLLYCGLPVSTKSRVRTRDHRILQKRSHGLLWGTETRSKRLRAWPLDIRLTRTWGLARHWLRVHTFSNKLCVKFQQFVHKSINDFHCRSKYEVIV